MKSQTIGGTIGSYSPTNEDVSEHYDPEKHATTTNDRTDSEVEQIAERIETRRAQRVRVTFNSRIRFLKDCRRIAIAQGYEEPKISLQDVKDYRDRVIRDELKAGKGINNNHFFHHVVGLKSDVQCLVKILERAVEVFENPTVPLGGWLYYKDFSFDHTQVVSRYPFVRHPLGIPLAVVFLFYLFTPILFCVIMPSSNICKPSRGALGWVDALYFASTTLSTVGYGDLTVDQDPKYASFVGSMYMLVAMVVAVVAFSAVASTAFSPLEKPFVRAFAFFNPKDEKDWFLYERIRRLKIIKITELAANIFSFIVLGVLGSQLVCYYKGNEEDGTNWTWMTSFYWAVQTTTTIGYGDLDQPESLRYFKIFYLLISTALTGSSLGKLGSLKQELADIRKEHAWNRRPVTRRMVDEMQAYVHDDKVDQYEFLVASLIMLGKLSSDDIQPIMEKFRQHAGDKGYIAVEDMVEDEMIGSDDTQVKEEIEEDVIDVEE